MARKVGQLISRGSRTRRVRISLGRDPETGTQNGIPVRVLFGAAQIFGAGRTWQRAADPDRVHAMPLSDRTVVLSACLSVVKLPARGALALGRLSSPPALSRSSKPAGR